MLRILTSFYGYTIKATDGEIGSIHEYLFEDDTWKIRHLVVKLGKWLTGRRVLVPVEAIERPDLATISLFVGLTKEQVENCRSLDAMRPVSQQLSGPLHESYDWLGFMPPGKSPLMPLSPLTGRVHEGGGGSVPEGETNGHRLCSSRSVVGCEIRTGEELIGHLEDFILDDEHWRIRYLVIGTGNRLTRRHLLISSSWISATRWDQNRVQVDLRRESVEQSPEYDPGAPVDREYEVRLYDYYFGRPFNSDANYSPWFQGHLTR